MSRNRNNTASYAEHWDTLKLWVTLIIKRFCSLPCISTQRQQWGTNWTVQNTHAATKCHFFFNNQQDALTIQIYSVIKLCMFRASSLPIIRSFPLYIRLIRKDVYSNMKLLVSAYSGHHQVSIPLKGGVYIWVGGVDVEISMHQFPVAPIVYCK